MPWMATSPAFHRALAAFASAVLLAGVGGCAIAGPAGSGPASTAGSTRLPDATPAPLAAVGTAPSTLTADPASATPFAFPSIDVSSSAPPRFAPDAGGDPNFLSDTRRPAVAQDDAWLAGKAAGRVALVGGHIVTLPATADPMTLAGASLAPARTLDTNWSRWIVEPVASGHDAKGRSYYDLSYWNLCGPGAATVALYYWQRLTGTPDVTGTAGYFVDPYAADGVDWPSPGPILPSSTGTRIGTYWSGTDRSNGFEAHARGFIMHIAMDTQPASWSATGIAVFATPLDKALYPTRGASRVNIQTALNWEIAGAGASGASGSAARDAAPVWQNTWYASVLRTDPTLDRDLQAAVMLDVGRDGVPVVVALDTFDLPNWQAFKNTPHTRHAVSIVGYDNTANPPTYTYLDTCGRSCNSRGGNQNGQIHVIAQSKMVAAIQDFVGSGFVW